MKARFVFAWFLTIGIVGLARAIEPPAAGPPDKAPSEQQIKEQINKLNKQLEEQRAKAKKPPTGDGKLTREWLSPLTWRAIGPAAMGGRIVAVSVFEADPSTYWVATASGGLLRTANNGNTFEHQFDHEATVSLGDVCVAPSNRNIVWVGTGEANPRNSVSYGDGVYKSTDGGWTWRNMGLKRSFQIGKIVIHPTNPDIVYVGALGRLYGPNEERGVYKTMDGGKTWDKVLSIDDKTGIIALAMSPADPETLLAAAWERQRDEFDNLQGERPAQDGYDGYDPIKKWGPGSGLYKTTDGGKNWRKVTKGLPTCALGRMGLDYYRKNPSEVFLILESEKIGMGPAPAAPSSGYLGIVGQDAEAGTRVTRAADGSPAARAGIQPGDVILAVNDQITPTHRRLLDRLANTKPGDQVRLKITRGSQSKEITATLAVHPRNVPGRPFTGFLSGQRENAQEKQGPEGYEYGGVYKSTDGGDSWVRINSVNPRPMYFSQVRVDPSNDQYLYVLGFTIYRSRDGGKTFRPDGSREVHPDQHCLWIDPRDGRHMIVGCDGGFYQTHDRMNTWDHLNHLAIGQFYHVTVDNRHPYQVYGGLQDNGSWGGPSISLSGQGPVNDDWFVLGGGDGFVCRVDASDQDVVYCESQDGNIIRRNLRTGAWGWIHPGPHKEKRFRSDARTAAVLAMLGLPAPVGLERREVDVPYRFNWNTPFLLSHHNPRILYMGGDRVFRSLQRGDGLKPISPEITRTPRGSATALAESPRNPDVLYVGTDDGFVWVTRDGGANWTNVTDKLLGLPANERLPGPRWVASIEASRHADGRAYVALDAHRSDDDQAYLYVTEDFGQTWKSIRANIPAGSTRVLREDISNPDLLFAGTEFAAWVSADRGGSWVKFNNNLPTVAVHEFAIHPTAGEMVAATHGRSLWIVDIAPLRQMTPAILKEPAHLYEPTSVVMWRHEPARGTIYGSGSRHYTGRNRERSASFYYSLAAKATTVDLKVVDLFGRTVRELSTETTPGLHQASWDLIGSVVQPDGKEALKQVGKGTYRVILSVDGQEFSQPLRIEPDPTVPEAVPGPYPDDPRKAGEEERGGR